MFYYVTSGSNETRDVHRWVTVDYQQRANDNRANQIHGFAIDYGKFILNIYIIYCHETEHARLNSLKVDIATRKHFSDENEKKERTVYFTFWNIFIQFPRQ